MAGATRSTSGMCAIATGAAQGGFSPWLGRPLQCPTPKAASALTEHSIGYFLPTLQLLRYKRPVPTIFDLLGSKEDDMTYSLGYVVSRSPCFAKSLLRHLAGTDVPLGQGAVVRLQTIEGGGGRTDVEIRVGDFFAILEAKRGPWLPTVGQLELYARILAREQVASRWLVVVTNAPAEHAATLPAEIGGVPVRHVSWRNIKQLAEAARADETNRNKHLLDEFTAYLREILGMENIRSNMVLVLALGNGSAWGLSFKEVVLRQRRYFDPVERHRRGVLNYIAFRYDGRLKSIHHVEKIEVFTHPKRVFPEAQDVEVPPHYLFHLGPSIAPPHEVKNGPEGEDGRPPLVHDPLLTCATITDAFAETKRRLGGDMPEAANEAYDR
jgi:hypothetical protein